MTYQEAIEGSEAVLEFLQETQDDMSFSSFETPKMKKMEEILSKIDLPKDCASMVGFTLLLNDQYKIMTKPLWEKSAKEFFSTQKSITLFNSFLRDKKLETLLS
jgi:hypothetical protein